MIDIRQLNYSVGSFALGDVSLRVEPGEYFVLLGSSGAGKTLLMECLCGLNWIDSGQSYIDGVDVTGVEPRRRGIGYLPQDYALFPHKTVRHNIAFGLRFRRLTRIAIRQRVDQLMDQLDVAHLADRFPQKLSGGEQQRVALARALAIEPRVLVLDEPVSALDEQTRDELCRQLKRLHRDTRTTVVHVCHNFAEMLAVADRVGIVHEGRILQTGTPQEVLQRPKNTLVARFVQGGNLFSARARTAGEGIELDCSAGIKLRARAADFKSADAAVTAMVRPENIHLAAARPESIPPAATVLEGSIREVVDMGPSVRVTVACARGAEVLVFAGKREYNNLAVDVGGPVVLTIAPEDVHVMQH